MEQPGSIPWDQSAERGVYQVAFPGYGVQIRRVKDDFVLSVLNEEGTVIEVFDDTQVPVGEFTDGPFSAMLELYERARRQALGVEEALDFIISELEKKD